MSADVVVVGGGPNGLVASTLLARAGRKVTLLERADAVGGLAAGFEFHPGYHSTGLLPRVLVPEGLARELGLALTGARASVLLADPAGPHLLLPGELSAMPEALRNQGLSDDAKGIGALAAVVAEIRPLLTGLLEARAPVVQGQPDLGSLLRTALRLRSLGRGPMMELLRIAPGCIDDLLREQLHSERLIAGLAADALPGTWMGPRSPGTSAMWLLHHGAEGRTTTGATLVAALETAARAAGVTIQHNANVSRIRLEQGRVVGVEIHGQGGMDADTVVSALDPKRTLLHLVAPTELPPAIERDVRGVRSRGAHAWVLLALAEAPVFAGHPGVTHFRVGSAVNDWERCFDAVKYRRLPASPTLDVRLSSEAVGVTLEVGVHGVPYALDGGWTEAARDALAASVLDQLQTVLPTIREQVVASRVLSPFDIEARTGASGGHVSHGELGLDQLWAARPTLKLARQSTGIPGLFLASPGTHPGSVWTGGSGRLAAQAALAG